MKAKMREKVMVGNLTFQEFPRWKLRVKNKVQVLELTGRTKLRKIQLYVIRWESNFRCSVLSEENNLCNDLCIFPRFRFDPRWEKLILIIKNFTTRFSSKFLCFKDNTVCCAQRFKPCFYRIHRWQTKPKMSIHGDLYYEVSLTKIVTGEITTILLRVFAFLHHLGKRIRDET